ncbi:MAG: hypothetical protein JNJ62_06740 [Pseudoxanthomonas mexicana]|nr:hypothetical protein [Pseudoxanthomonas mexicana]
MSASSIRKAVERITSLHAEERDREVVSWIECNGELIPLSYYGDERIDLSPYMPNPASDVALIKVSSIHFRWRHSFLDVLFTYWNKGRPGSSVPKASSVIRVSQSLTVFLNWLAAKDIWRFRDVSPPVFREFVEHLSSSPIESWHPRKGKKRRAEGIKSVVWACVLPWELRG